MKIVLPATEAELAAGGDVLREVVYVESVCGDEAVRDDSVMIDFGLRLDEASLIGEHGGGEEIELGKFFKNPRTMDSVGVGEKNQPMTFAGKLADAGPHRLVGGEDLLPGVAKFGRCDRAANHFNSPSDVAFHLDTAGFELVLAVEHSVHPRGEIQVAVGKETGERSLEIEVEKDAADVEKEGHVLGI